MQFIIEPHMSGDSLGAQILDALKDMFHWKFTWEFIVTEQRKPKTKVFTEYIGDDCKYTGYIKPREIV